MVSLDRLVAALAACLLLVTAGVVPLLPVGSAASGTDGSLRAGGVAVAGGAASVAGDSAVGSPGATRRVAEANVTSDRVQRAIADARSYVLSSPNKRGDHWASNIAHGDRRAWDVRYTIEFALVLHRLDAAPEHKRRAVEYVLSKREPGGGWNDTIADFSGLLLLRSLNGSYDEARADVRAELQRRGANLTTFDASTPRDAVFLYRTRVFYALMDADYTVEELFPNRTAFAFPALLFETEAFEGEFAPTDNAVSHNALDTMVALSILAKELAADSDAYSGAAGSVGVIGNGSVGASNDSVGASNDSAVAAGENATLADLLLARRQTSGAWATGFDTMYAALALHETGRSTDAEPVRIALRWLTTNRQASSGRFVAFKTPVWDTAWTVHALIESGISPHNASVERGAQWLVDAKTTTNVVRSDRNLTLERPPVPFRDHYGYGWSYKPALQSNWGDTAVAVNALAPYDDVATREEVRFLFRVQNDDGRWSTWASDFEPLNASERERLQGNLSRGVYRTLFGDEPVPDTNGHVLLAVGRHGYTTTNASLQPTVEYLLSARDDTGMWPGKWGIRYTYSTSRVLLGLRAVGADMDRPEIREATEALIAHQNPDGGWGERVPGGGSFPGWDAGGYLSADSTAAQTAWALQALLAAGVSPDHPAVVRGVEYLLATQRADGSWPASAVMYQGAPPAYIDPVWTQASVLLALSMYADAAGVSLPGEQPDEGFPVPPWLVADLLVGLAVVAVGVRLGRNS